MTYAEKLKDPRWYTVRMAVLYRTHYTCEDCGYNPSTDEERKRIDVHHGCYILGLEPWEYPLETLHPLCQDCHFYRQDVVERTLLKRLAMLSTDQLRNVMENVLQWTATPEVRDKIPATKTFREIFGDVTKRV